MIATHASEALFDREEIEQRLRGMGMPAVAGIDHRRFYLLGYDVRGTGLVVAHHDEVRTQGLQGSDRIDE
jgi:hypothetical protein